VLAPVALVPNRLNQTHTQTWGSHKLFLEGQTGGGACVAPRAQPIFCNKGSFGDTKALWESTRWEHFAAPLSAGSNSLHVITCYGVSGASVDTIRFSENERNLALLLDHADSLGHVPV